MHRHSTSDPNFQSSPRLANAHWDLAIPHRPTTVAGRHILRRYHVCSELADLIAVMAGLQEDQQ
jgi:hypothetical protein